MSQVKESESVSGSVMSDSLEPHGLFESSGTVAHQAPLSMEFSRQEYWSGLPCPPPGDLPDPGMEPASLMSPALAGGLLNTSTTWEALSVLQKPLLCPKPQNLYLLLTHSK